MADFAIIDGKIVLKENLVEVVRCKDCQYYYEQPRGFSPICELTRSRTEKEGFCSWGKRKEDAEHS